MELNDEFRRDVKDILMHMQVDNDLFSTNWNGLVLNFEEILMRLHEMELEYKNQNDVNSRQIYNDIVGIKTMIEILMECLVDFQELKKE